MWWWWFLSMTLNCYWWWCWSSGVLLFLETGNVLQLWLFPGLLWPGVVTSERDPAMDQMVSFNDRPSSSAMQVKQSSYRKPISRSGLFLNSIVAPEAELGLNVLVTSFLWTMHVMRCVAARRLATEQPYHLVRSLWNISTWSPSCESVLLIHAGSETMFLKTISSILRRNVDRNLRSTQTFTVSRSCQSYAVLQGKRAKNFRRESNQAKPSFQIWSKYVWNIFIFTDLRKTSKPRQTFLYNNNIMHRKQFDFAAAKAFFHDFFLLIERWTWK